MMSVSLAALAGCPEETTIKLVHEVIDKICGGVGPRLPDYGKTFSPGVFHETIVSLTTVTKKAIGTDTPVGELVDGLPENITNVITNAVEARNSHLKEALMQETCKIGCSYLKDFDWNVKLAVSSDTTTNLDEPLLHFSLKVAHPDSSEEDVRMELSKHELRALIAKMEKANEALRDVKGSFE
eukprot:m.332689 g.332689  ORF g.332689 m.332689 type:complete len:183 (+) comp16990_c0_seq1:161-709(+)